MRDTLPKKPKTKECGIVNLDKSTSGGTHWVAYIKYNRHCEYFDSFGDLKPPTELINYLKDYLIFYNYTKYQSYNTVNCGHLCLEYLRNFWKKKI